MRPAMIHIKRSDLLPEQVAITKFPQFIGQLDQKFDIDSIVGMSGGPIIGVGEDTQGNYCYWIVAIQSRWLPERKIVFGCSLPVLGELVEAELQRVKEA